MTIEVWALIAAGAVVALLIGSLSRQVERTNKLLEHIHEELMFANKDAHEIERRERFPDLPY